MLYDRIERGRERSQPESRFGKISGMIETAENLAARVQHQPRTQRTPTPSAAISAPRPAWDAGEFDRRDRGPVQCRSGAASPVLFAQDEGVRARLHPGKPSAELRALRSKGGVVTAGNASQQNDAAAACLMVGEDMLEELGLGAHGVTCHGWAAAGCERRAWASARCPAVERLMARSGLVTGIRLDLVELNEAFAVPGAGGAQGLGLGPTPTG